MSRVSRDALLDIADDGLQFVEKAIEALRQLAQFIVAVVGQALGEIAVALDNGVEHVRHPEQGAV